MAERYLFFNSVETSPGVYDRVYQESDFADYFGSVLSTGLLHTDNQPGMKVTVQPGTLNTIVSAGKAIMKGHLYENTTDLTLTHSLPEATMDRIDRIVLRLDQRNQSRFIKLFVKEGAPGADPAVPSLQRDNFIYEISLAQVRIRKNTVQISESDLIDERLNEQVCGLVYSLISVPGDIFLDKVQKFQNQWDEWFGNIQGELPNSAKLVSVEDASNYFKGTNVESVLKELFDLYTGLPKVERSNKDGFGTFKTLVLKERGTDIKIAELTLDGTAPYYTTRNLIVYASDGTTIVKRVSSAITYDADGDWTVI